MPVRVKKTRQNKKPLTHSGRADAGEALAVGSARAPDMVPVMMPVMGIDDLLGVPELSFQAGERFAAAGVFRARNPALGDAAGFEIPQCFTEFPDLRTMPGNA